MTALLFWRIVSIILPILMGLFIAPDLISSSTNIGLFSGIGVIIIVLYLTVIGITDIIKTLKKNKEE